MSISDRIPSVPGSGSEQSARLALLGHDLRAAVSDIIGGLRLVPQASLDPEVQVQLERVRASGEVLARLMEEALAQMLGEDEFAATHPANVQLARLLYDVEMRWSGRAREKGLGFELTVAPDVPAVLTIDRLALERVLANTLSNAMNHSDTGTVRLDVDLAPSGALRMAVSDQGPGFSAAAMARLFEFGGRPDGASKPGQGLGMHITRAMTGRLGGTISVQNRPEGGARVTLELPPECWTMTEATADPVALPDLTGLKVLVAEDNATNQLIIGRMLKRLGAYAEFAADGVEAAARLAREDFDLGLVDVEMPRLSGLDVIRGLRAGAGRNRTLPVIAVTAYVLRANRDAIHAAGADAILGKPLAGIETFGSTIARLLDRRRAGAGVGADPRRKPASQSLERLLAAAGPDCARELLDRLCSDLRGAERDLVTGLAQGIAARVRACTHVIAALAGAVGAETLHARASALNLAAGRGEQELFPVLGRETLAGLDRLITHVEGEKLRRAGA
jgi:CheY-like chemotaxis protein